MGQPSNGYWVRFGAAVTSAFVAAFFLGFLATRVWAHEGRIVRVETQFESIMQSLRRIEGRLEERRP